MELRCVIAFASASVSVSRPAEAENSSSRAFIALRTSPPQEAEMCRTTSGSSASGASRRLLSSATARATAPSTSEAATGLNSNTVERLRMALKTQK